MPDFNDDPTVIITAVSSFFAYIDGIDEVFTERLAYINGLDSANDKKNVYTCGYDTRADTSSARIFGVSLQVNGFGGVISGYEPQRTNIIYMPAILTSSIPIGIIDPIGKPLGSLGTTGPVVVGAMRK